MMNLKNSLNYGEVKIFLSRNEFQIFYLNNQGLIHFNNTYMRDKCEKLVLKK